MLRATVPLAGTIAVLGFAGLLLAPSPARANDKEDCYSRVVDRVLKGCTRIINSRGVSRADLAEAYAARAGGHFDNNDTKAALLDVDKAIDIDPKNGLAWAWRGHILNQRNEPRQALESFNSAIAYNPKDAGAWEGRALSRIELGDFKGAIQDADRSLQIDPKIAAAYVLRGRARAGLEQYEAAFGDYERASRVDPKLWSVPYNRALLYRRIGKLKEALADADRSIALDLTYENLLLRGLIKGENGDTNGALVDFDRTIDSWPEGSAAHVARAIYSVAKNDLNRALRHAGRAIELGSAQGHEARGVAYQAAGEHAQAIADFGVALDKAKNDPGQQINVLIGRARSYAAISYHVEARADAERASKLKPVLPREHASLKAAKDMVAEYDRQGYGTTSPRPAVAPVAPPSSDLTRQPTSPQAGAMSHVEFAEYVPADGSTPQRFSGWMLTGHPSIGYCGLRQVVGNGYVEYRRYANGAVRWLWSDPRFGSAAPGSVTVRFDDLPSVAWRWTLEQRRGEPRIISVVVPENWLATSMPKFDRVRLAAGGASIAYTFSGFSRGFATLNRCAS